MGLEKALGLWMQVRPTLTPANIHWVSAAVQPAPSYGQHDHTIRPPARVTTGVLPRCSHYYAHKASYATTLRVGPVTPCCTTAGVPGFPVPPGSAQPRAVQGRLLGTGDGCGGRPADDTRVCCSENDVVPGLSRHPTGAAACRRALGTSVHLC